MADFAPLTRGYIYHAATSPGDVARGAWDLVRGGDQPQEPQQAPSSPAAQSWAPMGPEWASGWTRTLQQRGQLK